ncbi:FecR family protein [Roseivirga sp.]|uniref:FecR family protein n=1 Tax=Roseivirga sp. TaxID=1964215 RepID=UPI002B267E3E|nr:FecR domain-containing protein [Roseivirga sp.]
MENFDKKIESKLSSHHYDESPNDASTKRMFDMLDKVLPQETKVVPLQVVKPAKSVSSFFLKVAASIAILLIAGYGFYAFNEVEVSVGNTAQQEVVLPDGSIVTMNSGSQIQYNKLLWKLKRELSLEGEAFFEVEKGEKFVVNSTLGRTQVLGTSFNIYARGKKYEVKCSTGKVLVSSNRTHEEVILLPGEGVVLKEEILRPFEYNKEENEDWRQGEFYFDQTFFDIVIAELERQYGVTVSYPDSYKKERYTGYFNNKDLAQALKLICEPIGLEAKQKGKLIELIPLEE